MAVAVEGFEPLALASSVATSLLTSARVKEVVADIHGRLGYQLRVGLLWLLGEVGRQERTTAAPATGPAQNNCICARLPGPGTATVDELKGSSS